MIDFLSACNIFPVLLLYKSNLTLFQLSSTITTRPKDETLAVYSFVTIDYKRCNKMEFKECAKTTGFCSAGHILPNIEVNHCNTIIQCREHRGVGMAHEKNITSLTFPRRR